MQWYTISLTTGLLTRQLNINGSIYYIIKYYFTFCPFNKILALNTFDSLIKFKEIKSSPLLF